LIVGETTTETVDYSGAGRDKEAVMNESLLPKKSGHLKARILAKRLTRGALALILAAFISLGPVLSSSSIAYAEPGNYGLATLAGPLGSFGYIVGTTPIPEGMAVGANDITLYNENIGFSLAISTNSYWNMTQGSILDIAIRDGGTDTFVKDLVNDAGFLNDLWTPTGTYPGTGENLLGAITVDTPVVTGSSVSVTVHTRYWVADADKNGIADEDEFGVLQEPLNVSITYELESGTDYIKLITEVENPENNDVIYTDMYAGYSISTLAASMFGPFGFYPDVKVTGIGIGSHPLVEEYFGNYVATYDTDYAVMLWMDGADSYKGSSGYKDLYILSDYEPYDGTAGTTYTFYGEVLVSGTAATAGIMDRYIANDSSGSLGSNCTEVSGTVRDSIGDPIANAYVIAKKEGVYLPVGSPSPVSNIQPLIWAVTDANGEFSMLLPSDGWTDPLGGKPNEFIFKVEAAGYTSVQDDVPRSFSGAMETANFALLDGAPVHLTAVDGDNNPIPFKVSISGLVSEIKTL